MQLILKNFGPIKNCQLDLSKKFYVLVGYNNSGKTYLSQLLWCLFNEETIEEFSLSKFCQSDDRTLQENRLEITPTLLDSILGKFAQFLKQEILPTKLKVGNSACVIGENFALEFQYDLKTIRQQSFQTVESVSDAEICLISKNQGDLTITFENRTSEGRSGKSLPASRDHSLHRLLVVGRVMTLLHVVFNQVHHTFFLPANRPIFPGFYYYLLKIDREHQKQVRKQLLNYLEKQQQENGGRVELMTSLPRQWVDNRSYNDLTEQLVEQINELWESESKPTPYYAELVGEMSKILGGDIVVERAAGMGPAVISFQMSKPAEKLPMYLSSSAVNQLALLYLYFQYWAAPDHNFLLIDEPEENLHPQNQIALCNVLLRFGLANHNRVLINTHSPLLTKHVNSYLYLGMIKGQYGDDPEQVVIANQLNLRPELAISPAEVGVYFFNGHEVKNYEANEYGVYFRDFHKVTSEVEEANRILSHYLYLKGLGEEGEEAGETGG